MLKVAIQGEAGCFHDAAAHSYFRRFGEVTTVPCETFPDMFDALGADPELLGVMAIENTIAGPLLPNHELLRRSGMQVIGEIKERISHMLCALPGQEIDDITEVNSHPMALMQCERFLRRHPRMKAVERDDTAGSAAEIARLGLRGHAAICGEFAADLYGLPILARSIETNPHNFTRFLVLAHPDDPRPDTLQADRPVDKAMVEFTLPHTTGALSKVLTIFSFYDINLTKIQSTPIVGREWEYRFYVDLSFDSPVRYRQSLEAVRPLVNRLTVMGEFAGSPNPVPSWGADTQSATSTNQVTTAS
ncbi:MAG: prephenate dehydratase [Muribaculaceae bacterium]|nr:prephenate dehydratase [Muribaculaceae bacterium]